jgi:hypothetical protein
MSRAMGKSTAHASKRAGVPAWRLRFAAELSYEVTVVEDATASYFAESPKPRRSGATTR